MRIDEAISDILVVILLDFVPVDLTADDSVADFSSEVPVDATISLVGALDLVPDGTAVDVPVWSAFSLFVLLSRPVGSLLLGDFGIVVLWSNSD